MFKSIPYSVKVRTLISKLLTKREYDIISEQDNVVSIGTYLEKLEYGKVILKYSTEISRIEEELWNVYYEGLERLYNYIPITERSVFNYFIFKKLEIENLKEILMGIALNIDRDKIFDKVHRKFREKFKEIIYSETLDEAVMKLKGEGYYERLIDGLKYYKERGNIYKMLSNLDHYYYENLTKYAIYNISLSKILRARIDKENLKLLLRYILEKNYKEIPREEFISLLIPNGKITRFEELIESESIERFVMNITDTPFFEKLNASVKKYKEIGDIDILDKAIDEAYLDILKSILVKPFGIDIPICYAEMKRFEVVNLIKILKLKHEGIEPEIIKDKVVIII